MPDRQQLFLGVVDASAGPERLTLSGMLNLRRLDGRYLLQVEGDPERPTYWLVKVYPDETVTVGRRAFRARGVHDVFHRVEALAREAAEDYDPEDGIDDLLRAIEG